MGVVVCVGSRAAIPVRDPSAGAAEILTQDIGPPSAAIAQRMTRAAEPPEPMSDETLAEAGRVVLAIAIERVTAVSHLKQSGREIAPSGACLSAGTRVNASIGVHIVHISASGRIGHIGGAANSPPPPSTPAYEAGP